MMTQGQKAERFKALHESEPFVIPNPWDAGTARILEGVGFPALTTTSSGFAFTLGRLDGQVTLDELCGHVALLNDVTGVPIAVDLENGYGPRPEDAAAAIVRAASAGAVGGSIEDWDPETGLYPLEQAVARVAAAHEAAARLDFPFMLVARAENHIRGNPDLADTIARLQAFEAAGADVLYAPGLRSTGEIKTVCAAVSRPVNVLGFPGLTVREIFDAGAQRISVGGFLTWTAGEALAQAAERIRDEGDLSVLAWPKRIHTWLAG
jgi:2-methylisocitrate lyase-like PEP mutase family enzyme